MAALSTCDEDLLRLLLDFKADVNLCDGVEDMNALGLAILLNEVSLMELLLKHGAKVNTLCCGNLVPIQLAMNKSTAVSNMLIQYGADVHQLRTVSLDNKLFTSQSPLHVAILRKNVHLSRLLLEHGEDVNQTFNDSLESPVHQAVRNLDLDMINLLIEFGADLNRPNFERHTPVGLALMIEDPVATVIAKRLILAGASANQRTRISFFQKTYSPLHIACFKGNLDFVRFLVEEVCGRIGYWDEEMETPTSDSAQVRKEEETRAPEKPTKSVQEACIKLLPRNERFWGTMPSSCSSPNFRQNSASSPTNSNLAPGALFQQDREEYHVRSEVSPTCFYFPTHKAEVNGRHWRERQPHADPLDTVSPQASGSSEPAGAAVTLDTATRGARICRECRGREDSSGASRSALTHSQAMSDNNSPGDGEPHNIVFVIGGEVLDIGGEVQEKLVVRNKWIVPEEEDTTRCYLCEFCLPPDALDFVNRATQTEESYFEEVNTDENLQAASRSPLSSVLGPTAASSVLKKSTLTGHRSQMPQLSDSDVMLPTGTSSSVPSEHPTQEHSVELDDDTTTQTHSVPPENPTHEHSVELDDDTTTKTHSVPPENPTQEHSVELDDDTTTQIYSVPPENPAQEHLVELDDDTTTQTHTIPSESPTQEHSVELDDVELDNDSTSQTHSVPSESPTQEDLVELDDVELDNDSTTQTELEDEEGDAIELKDATTQTCVQSEVGATPDLTGTITQPAVRAEARTASDATDSTIQEIPVFQAEFGSPDYDYPPSAARWLQRSVGQKKRRRAGTGKCHSVARFLNQVGNDGSTALFMAVYDGNVDLVDYLLAHGANPYFSSQHGNFFHAAVLSQSVPLVQRALDLHCDINEVNLFGNSPLILVSRLDLPDACELQVSNGADMNSRDRYGETPLLASVYFGCEMNARVLIQHGADLDLMDDNNTSAIYWSIFNNRQRTLKLLLMAGALFTSQVFRQYPRNIRVMNNHAIFRFLQHFVCQPRSLQDLACIRIRVHLAEVNRGQSIFRNIAELPLPNRLKDRLRLKHFIRTIDVEAATPALLV